MLNVSTNLVNCSEFCDCNEIPLLLDTCSNETVTKDYDGTIAHSDGFTPTSGTDLDEQQHSDYGRSQQLPGLTDVSGRRLTFIHKLQDNALLLEKFFYWWKNRPMLWKLLVSVVYALTVFFIHCNILIVVHQRMPDPYHNHSPLPDIILEMLPYTEQAIMITERIIQVVYMFVLACIFLHQSRLVILRRALVIIGSAYLLRCCTVLFTSLPQSHEHLYAICKPLNDVPSFSRNLIKALNIMIGAGLRIQNGQTCGDYIYSGHTMGLTIGNLILLTYLPCTFKVVYYAVVGISTILNIVGVLCILLAHEHYTVDVVLGLYVAAAIFMNYHTLAHNITAFNGDSSTRLWSPIIYLLEYPDGEGKLINNCDRKIVNFVSCVGETLSSCCFRSSCTQRQNQEYLP